jgi:hypothetical protein
MSRKGRPAGSKNHNYAEAVAIPAACPACGSTELKAAPGRPVPVTAQDLAGEVNGFVYSRVEWHDKECGCGQRVRVRVYLP